MDGREEEKRRLKSSVVGGRRDNKGSIEQVECSSIDSGGRHWNHASSGGRLDVGSAGGATVIQ